MMQPLADGAAGLGIELSVEQLELFKRYLELLAAWNQRVNLTATKDPVEVQRRHFLDSLTCLSGAPSLLSQPGCRVIDVGSGAGFPGVPLKIILPGLRLTLLE